MKSRRSWVLGSFLVALVVTAMLALSGCKDGEPDPLTVARLQWIKSNGGPGDSCDVFVAYEKDKKAAKNPMYDSEAQKLMEKVCECFKDAGGDAAKQAPCMTRVDIALAHATNQK